MPRRLGNAHTLSAYESGPKTGVTQGIKHLFDYSRIPGFTVANLAACQAADIDNFPGSLKKLRRARHGGEV